ncbi:MAG: carboxylesterase family protein [Alphaproteobacteria bacterium]|nr:carboxylesterase family protein [Alphaproteobacteria bacterium]
MARQQTRHLTRRGALLLGGAFGLVGSAGAITEADIFPVVETTEGKYRGTAVGGVNHFKGVRYGADTSGKNRFMPPQAPPKFRGVRDATDYGQFAPQMPAARTADYTGLIFFDVQPGGMGEDCLVLNIWTPTLDRNAKRPVMLHIHGGGYYGGSGNSIGYDGEELARYGNAVVITVNHRLGAFGYLNLMDEGAKFAGSGVAGQLDLVAALKWIKANAENFGGDPGRVLVFGQSGGGAKTSVLLAMPSAKGLFHRAGVMSGSTLKLATREDTAPTTAALLKAVGLTKGETGKLQALPFQTILAAQATMEADMRAKGEAPRTFSPIVDGVEIPRNPFDPDAPPISADIPMIISTVMDERAYRLSNFQLDEAGFVAFAKSRAGAKGADLAAMYRRDDPVATPFVLQARLDTDSTFRKSAIIQSERKAAQAAAGGAPLWTYLYALPSPAFGGRYGTPHGSDVGPALHDVRGGLNDASLDSVRVADQLASAWVAFAATGNPNNPNTPDWATYTVPKRTTMVFDRYSHVQDDPRKAFREFWASQG